MKLPSLGRKSQIDYLSDGSVKKIYNQNDDPAGKFRREVGFYRHYGGSRLIPTLLDSSPDAFIVIERVTGDLMHDVDLTTDDLNMLTDSYVDQIVQLFNASAPCSDFKDQYFAGRGADENLASLHDSLSRLASNGDDCAPLFHELSELVAKVELSDELLINRRRLLVDTQWCAVGAESRAYHRTHEGSVGGGGAFAGTTPCCQRA